MATATYAEGELVVTVPKGAGPDDGDGDGAAVLGGAGAESVLLLV
uniref:SHSP domain-containing protein n=1 Tax=Arundo donax TaxID=35708 RepID=A0A0A9DA84_ARUDO